MLADFQGLCFASTQCRVFKIGESWSLSPFCGQATCISQPSPLSPTGFVLIERVKDCGPLPKQNPHCKITNEADKEAAFPTCCPKFVCEEGHQLEYPTAEELAAAARSTAA